MDSDVQRAFRRLDRPEPRLALGRQLRGLASAALDVSDGVAGDVRHMLAASSQAAGMALEARLTEGAIPFDPVLERVDRERRRHLALHGGDDYELLFTAETRHRDAIVGLHPSPMRIGTIQASANPDRQGAVVLVCDDGMVHAVQGRGFDHFETT